MSSEVEAGRLESTTLTELADRDVVLGNDIPEPKPKANLYLQDLIRLHRIIAQLRQEYGGTPAAEDAATASIIAEAIYAHLAFGKLFELAGLKDVPQPYLSGPGRFVKATEGNPGTFSVLSEEDAKSKLSDAIMTTFTQEQDLGVNLADIPYVDLGNAMINVPPIITAAIVSDPKDAVLVPSRNLLDSHDKLYESQGGNRAIFNLASQLVTTNSLTSEKRVEAAIAILKGLSEAEVIEEDKDTRTTTLVSSSASRFLVRGKPPATILPGGSDSCWPSNYDAESEWAMLHPDQAAFFVLGFCFEVFLEKGIHLMASEDQMNPGVHTSVAAAMAAAATSKLAPPQPDPIMITTDADVLFGRGGSKFQLFCFFVLRIVGFDKADHY